MQRDDAIGDARSRVATDAHKSPHKKKTYAAPVVVLWGTLLDMTKHAGDRGHMDGGKIKTARKTR
jgi:hypothetical protein